MKTQVTISDAWRLTRWMALALAGALLLGCATENAERAERSKKALVLWQERCKSAGVTIHRTADDVEGIFVLKHRPRLINEGEQFVMDDPYGRDWAGEDYVFSFIYSVSEVDKTVEGKPIYRVGYKYADAIDPKDGVRYRYSGQRVPVDPSKPNGYKKFEERKIPSSGPAPRYGITYEDISTREDREYWIAGSALRIIDLQTGEVMAQRIGYMIDLAQGSTAGARRPWLFAANNACPSFGSTYGAQAQGAQAARLAVQVLKPKQD